MSKDDMETNTMNVMFDGSDESDKDDDDIDKKTEKMVEYFEDDYYRQIYIRRNSTSR